MIYGIVIVGSVIAVESAAHPSAAGETFATVLVLIIYWMAHAYSEMMGERFRTSRPLDWGHAKATLRHEAAIMRGASLPIVAMIVAMIVAVIAAVIAGATADTTAWVGIIAAMLSLSCVALLGGMRAHLRPWPLAAQALVGIVFGVAIGGVRAMLG